MKTIMKKLRELFQNRVLKLYEINDQWLFPIIKGNELTKSKVFYIEEYKGKKLIKRTAFTVESEVF